ncbi:MAG: hypothetical protein AAF845_07265 [Bacteroidota bacterium]
MLVDVLSPDTADLTDRLAAIADDTPAFGEALRAMLWEVYTEAGRPLGPDEEAMLAWWGFGQGTTVQ